MDSHLKWAEPVVRVQSLSESGATLLPPRYIKPPDQRPTAINHNDDFNIPIIDLSPTSDAKAIATAVSAACKEWGVFQAVNHGVSPDLLHRARKLWRAFFHLPMKSKEAYANSPKTYEGYGSRVGIEKDAILDWGDYFYLHYFPLCLKNHDKWLALPSSLREMVDEYGKELEKLCVRVMGLMSLGLGLEEGRLQRAFGGHEAGVCMKVNYYPICPQPELALGLSAHTDHGGITVLLPDEKVSGLQVRHKGEWATVRPVADALIVNVGDQVQILSNSTYSSVEHRALVNSKAERLSIAFFYNPKGDVLVGPIQELVGPEVAALYKPMTFNQFRLHVREHGPRGKSQVESLKVFDPRP
ncbi:probable 2-oxoglutarate-dependent dioxygenase At3g111800 isoform X2 [Phalaenopsis equestris]|uniref:probable 2-oxoglutarate-dependent dioxygenase At3g111800 isoform X2 n=1 Tax=Phalaenopsis equestris TaxID=78828 RepID=UPI0009E62BCF|nr:probable 2-oxoglutarate-dependent dioxygenase At3g111800 isoform X2 [Phalaenopsis equestris]